MMNGAAAVRVAVVMCMSPCGAWCSGLKNFVTESHSPCNEWFRGALQIAAQLLLAFDGFKQGLEVALAETAAAFALNDFVEQGGAVFYRLGEDLQHVTLVVAIDENAESFKLIEGLVDSAHAALQFCVVGMGDVEEFDTLLG